MSWRIAMAWGGGLRGGAALVLLMCAVAAVAEGVWNPVQQLVDDQFVARVGPSYLVQRDALYTRLEGLHERLEALQGNNSMACSQQIYSEAKWAVNYTADFGFARSRMDDLGASLANSSQGWAEEQQPEGGYWGPCYHKWFNRVGAMIDAVGALQAADRAPDYPITFVHNLTEPEGAAGIIAYYRSVLHTDLANASAPAVNHREELGAVTGTFHQLAWKSAYREWMARHEVGFNFSDAWVAAYTAFVDSDEMQDPATGMWGEVFANGSAPAVRAPDVSMTFHTVHYRDGKTPHLAQTMRTLRAIKTHRYAYGWLTAFGHLNSHNSYDIATCLKYAVEQGAVAGAELDAWADECEEMVEFAVSSPVSVNRTTGCFQPNAFYTSLSGAYYFGASALVRLGYFGQAAPFWAPPGRPAPSWPGNQTTCCTLTRCLERTGLQDNTAVAAFERLASGCPACARVH